MDRMDYLKTIVDNQKLIILIICYKIPLMGIFGNGNNSFEPMVSKNDKLQGNIYIHVHELGSYFNILLFENYSWTKLQPCELTNDVKINNRLIFLSLQLSKLIDINLTFSLTQLS